MSERCASWLSGHVCPDDLCHNATVQTLCGGWLEGLDDDYEDDDDDWDDDV